MDGLLARPYRAGRKQKSAEFSGFGSRPPGTVNKNWATDQVRLYFFGKRRCLPLQKSLFYETQMTSIADRLRPSTLRHLILRHLCQSFKSVVLNANKNPVSVLFLIQPTIRCRSKFTVFGELNNIFTVASYFVGSSAILPFMIKSYLFIRSVYLYPVSVAHLFNFCFGGGFSQPDCRSQGNEVCNL
jgi:hypothetical protein